MKTTLSCAALLATVTLAMPTSTAFADSGSGSDSGSDSGDVRGAAAGCVSDADFARLANGQLLSYIHEVAGADAQTSMRRWASGAYRYQERLYAMCTPSDSAHSELTTRFMFYEGAWRAFLVDTHVGPED